MTGTFKSKDMFEMKYVWNLCIEFPKSGILTLEIR